MVNKNIDYYNKDFSSLRSNLINYAKTYFPTYANDFSAASPGLMFIEMVAYVGDLLSFYIDKQTQETFIQTANERENVIQLANMLGYNHKNTSAANTLLTCAQLVPAGTNKLPDLRYALKVKEGSIIRTRDGNDNRFRLLRDVDFNLTASFDAKVTVYESDTATNDPIYYLIQKQVSVRSGILTEEVFTFDANTPPNTSIKLNKTDVIEILDVTDNSSANSKVWHEVDYLVQQTVISAKDNTDAGTSNETPSMISYVPIELNKKFIRRINSDNTTELIFGAGKTGNDIASTGYVIDSRDFEITKGAESISPTDFLYSQDTGDIPKNISLTVRYYYGGGYESNAASHTIKDIYSVNFGNNAVSIDQNMLNLVKDSLYFTNEDAACGGRGPETIDEIRQNAVAFFNSQNRCVTSQDYMSRSLSLPSKFGCVAKVIVLKGSEIEGVSTNHQNTLYLFCLAYDSNRKFQILNTPTKANLSTYLNQYKMVTDSVNILDVGIVNIGIEFIITVKTNYNPNEILVRCILELKTYFDNTRMQINRPIYNGELINLLFNVPGVQSVPNLVFTNKTEDSYSKLKYTLNSENTNNNTILRPTNYFATTTTTGGNTITSYTPPTIFEIKYPDVDIQGKVINN